MLIKMCKENSYAKMEKLGLKHVGVQDKALKLCPVHTICWHRYTDIPASPNILRVNIQLLLPIIYISFSKVLGQVNYR